MPGLPSVGRAGARTSACRPFRLRALDCRDARFFVEPALSVGWLLTIGRVGQCGAVGPSGATSRCPELVMAHAGHDHVF